ncbi:hypothetical protein [Streptococcus gallolyticus]|uniref:ABC-2 family transporter protein n=1 Tax=Streptococcus gallolyticus TaxID=315405 RepID=A0A1H9UZN0_9STRE|nr:hypothetical protein [Streptococcus gallolyticus]SES14945.1 ABC-2 family transporter protein [Streptococcus gallolyticus]
MFLAIFKSIFKRRDVGILLGFSLLPLITPFLMGNQDIDTMANSGFTSNLLSFTSGALDTQFKLIIPTLILGFIVSSVFRDEIDSGIMFLYKDISKTKIFKAKMRGLFLLYIIYLLMSVLMSMITYYVILIPHFGLKARLISGLEIGASVLMLLATIFLNLITISLFAYISIKKKTLVSVLSGVLFTLVSMIAPMLSSLKYLFPNSYSELLNQFNFVTALVIMVILFVVYFFTTYVLAKMRFKKLEF